MEKTFLSMEKKVAFFLYEKKHFVYRQNIVFFLPYKHFLYKKTMEG